METIRKRMKLINWGRSKVRETPERKQGGKWGEFSKGVWGE